MSGVSGVEWQPGVERVVHVAQQPVPDTELRGEPATKPVLTMLTCSELFHTDNRSVVIAELESADRGEPGPRTSRPPRGCFVGWLVGLIQGLIDFVQGS